MVALLAGLAMVAGVITATQLTSSALEERNGGLGAGECTPGPEQQAAAAAEENAAAEAAEGTAESGETADTTSTEELQLHREVEGDVVHYHYRRPGGWDGDDDGNATPAPDPTEAPPSETPPEDCEGEGDGGSGGEDPGDGDQGGGDPGDGDQGGEDPGDGDQGGDQGDGDQGDGDQGDGDQGTPPGVVPPGGADGNNNGLEILGRDCTSSDLPLHDGFQTEEARCVNAQMGEVSAVQNNPSLLITDNPEWVEVNESFEVTVSTRNLVRDRFLGAAAGGYYLESSFLTEDGIQRGHFHFACVNLGDGQVAPDPDTLLSPQFFTAVEDGGGGAGADFVTIEVPGLSEPGLYRCQAWAGDPSHRVPMMSFAREQIAVDAVRITVTEVDGAEGEGN